MLLCERKLSMSVKNRKAAVSKGSIQITGDGKYPLVPFFKIEIVERPEPGEESEKLFFNPRELSSFTPESMESLRNSIRADGLQQPPLVRAFTSKDGKSIDKVELIAGERRFRSIQKIIDDDLPCLDEDTKKPKQFEVGQVVVSKGHFGEVISHKEDIVTVQLLDNNNVLTDEIRHFIYDDVFMTISGRELYNDVPCRVVYDINDFRALRLAFAENDKAQSLSTREEIVLVERLSRRGLKVSEIAEHLGTNDTWVSQTSNFREFLPPEALDCLLQGNMKRHTAVKIMSYKPKDRSNLWASTVEAEAQETAEALQNAEEEVIQAEDEEVIAISDLNSAVKEGDEKAVKKAERVAASAAAKVEKAQEKKQKVESESGKIKISHIQKGAAKAGLNPKKIKMLSREEVEEHFISGLEEYLESGFDPVNEQDIPVDLVYLMQMTAKAIINGDRDAQSVLRQFMVEQGKWESECEDEAEEAESFQESDDDEDFEDEDVELDDEDFEDGDGPSDEDLESLSDDDFEDSYDEDDESFVRMSGRNTHFDDEDD